MSEWLKNLVGYLLIAGIGIQMIPNQKYEQYVRLFTGFLLVMIVLQPILQIRSSNQFLENKLDAFLREQEAMEQRISEECSIFSGELEGINKIQEIEEIYVEVAIDD